MKLIKRNIDAIEKPEKDLYLFDDDLAGFGLRVYPTGRKVFIAQYRVGGGRGSRQRRYTLGVFGKITAEDARTKAKDVLARAHLGEDTAEERDKVRRSQTVAQLIDAWSVDGALNNRRTGVRRKQVNIDQDVALANHHIRPLIGRRTVESLVKGDIQRVRTQIATGESKTKRKGRKRGLIKVTGGEGPEQSGSSPRSCPMRSMPG